MVFSSFRFVVPSIFVHPFQLEHGSSVLSPTTTGHIHSAHIKRHAQWKASIYNRVPRIRANHRLGGGQLLYLIPISLDQQRPPGRPWSCPISFRDLIDWYLPQEVIPAADRANEISGMDTITRSLGLLLLPTDFFPAELRQQWSFGRKWRRRRRIAIRGVRRHGEHVISPHLFIKKDPIWDRRDLLSSQEEEKVISSNLNTSQEMMGYLLKSHTGRSGTGENLKQDEQIVSLFFDVQLK